MRTGPGVLTFVVALACLAAAPATAQAPVQLSASLEARGYIGISASAPEGGPLLVGEFWRGTFEPITQSPTGSVSVRRALTWRCDRRHRLLVAKSLAGGRLSAPVRVRTPSCRKRFKVVLKPSRPRAGRPLSVLVLDRFGSGDVTLRVCAEPPRARARCRDLRLARGRGRGAVRFKASAGRWPVTVSTRGAPRARRVAVVRRRGGGLRILATGDSMIQILDSFLQQRLQRGRVRVRKESHISTGISKPSMLNWNTKARRQARGIRPDASVVFLGANDGFPIGRSRCCGRGWVRGYTRRVRDMMRSYSRGGSGTVYWLTLPVPRKAAFKPIYRAVNASIRRAARAYPDTVRVVDAEAVFTPGRRYTSTIRFGGRNVNVRQDDGVHLNTAGASIAATLVIRAMRRDGVL
ncbi:MAG TPA: GDSL-type esterase/lipase family protein [Thermoleophilaceae bacterium]|nr:GDSL-type esterase/lipase family protein [Thermoleophilaceae bacterium]